MAITLPYPDMDFTPLDVLTATEMDQIVSNYEYIANQFPIGTNDVQKPSSGAQWNKIPVVATNGVMEVGKFIDFHNTNTETRDYATRLYANDNASGNSLMLPAGTGRLVGTSAPIWSTFIVSQGDDGDLYFTSYRGNGYRVHRGNGGLWAAITNNGSGISKFKQTISARFSTPQSGNIGAANIARGSTVWAYWTGANNGAFQNKSEVHTAGASDLFATAIETPGSKSNIGISIIGTKVAENTNTWSLHCEIQCGGLGTSIFANIECTGADADSIPTLILRGVNMAAMPWCRNVVEILED